MSSDMSGKIITLRGHLLQTVKDFMEKNRLNPDRWVRYNGKERLDYHRSLWFTADVNRAEDPDGYEVELTDHNRITIPAGRMVSFGSQAGLITDVSVTLPLAPAPFALAMRIAGGIGDQFEKAGYHRKLRKDDLTEQDIREDLSQFLYYGKWLLPDTGLAKYSLDIEAYSSLSGVASPSPVPLTGPHSADGPETYLLRFYARVDGEISNELTRLSYARHVAVTGDWNESIPVRLWFDDPGWRPEGWKGKYIK